MNEPATVLIVDDDVTSIRIVAELLEPEFSVVFATSGEEALEIVPQVLPDLILLDVVMPGLDGYALCKRFKSEAATAAIPIIFITGLQKPDSESFGLELGAADYVTKPFSPNVVRARVRNHVELKQARDRLLSLAATDGMTGLFNRRAFDVALERECKLSARTHALLAIVMLDVDFFKPFNDRYGHVAGDDCLRQVATALVTAVHRPADFVARYGGEEFVCILPDTALAGAVEVAERIKAGLQRLAIPHVMSVAAPFVTASFGVSSDVCLQDVTGEALLLLADARMYKAKLTGRNRIVAADADELVAEKVRRRV